MRIAIIDLGTNTFNLLIAERDSRNSSFTILYNTKEGVKLGEGGINRKLITEAAFVRGIDAVGRHFERMKPFRVDKVVAFGTSAIRDAANGLEFAAALKERFNLEVRIIDGDREAELIYLGVKQTLSFTDRKFIILDIGGGSNEFIIADNSGILWKQSFKLGMARLLDKFKPSDPITASEIEKMEAYFDLELAPLFAQVEYHKPEIFVGASGSFDSFVRMLISENLIPPPPDDIFHPIPMEVYDKLHSKIIASTSLERDKMKGLEPVRRDMIVLATIFVNFVLKKTGIQTLCQSAYSLKEGAMADVS